MKDIQMNWTILTPDLKDKVLNIMVDDIFTEPNFRNDFLTKLGVTTSSGPSSSMPSSSVPLSSSKFSISSFGSTNYMIMIASAIFVTVLIYILFFYKKKVT